MAMNIGTEMDWLEGVEPGDEEGAGGSGDGGVVSPIAEDLEPKDRVAPPGEPPFHTEFLALCAKYGMEDFLYVVLPPSGAEMLMTYNVGVKPEHEDYRTRAARMCFNARGLLQHAEGTTWPLRG